MMINLTFDSLNRLIICVITRSSIIFNLDFSLNFHYQFNL